jgi:hypothetical protein
MLAFVVDVDMDNIIVPAELGSSMNARSSCHPNFVGRNMFALLTSDMLRDGAGASVLNVCSDMASGRGTSSK